MSEYPAVAYRIPERGVSRIVKLPEWLHRVGEHEAIHHYQCVGDPHFQARSDRHHRLLPPINQILTDMECEARQMADQIAISRGEKPLWSLLDKYLKEVYPGAYGKKSWDLIFYNLSREASFSTDMSF